MKFRMNFGVVKTIILAVIIAGALAIMGVDIAMLVRQTPNIAIACVSLCAAIIILVGASLVIFNSYYKFKDDKMVTVLGFFVDKFSYDEIVCLKQNGETRELYIVTKGLKPQDTDISFHVNINVAKADDFIKALRDKIGDVIVEVFTPEKKDKDEK